MIKLKQWKRLIICFICLLMIASISLSLALIISKKRNNIAAEVSQDPVDLAITIHTMSDFEYNNWQYFKINDFTDMEWFAELVSSGYSFKNKIVFLTKDLDFRNYVATYHGAGNYWIPIGSRLRQINGPFGSLFGTVDMPFDGTFDGLGYKISNLKLTKDIPRAASQTMGNLYSLGLFAIIGIYGTVQNLKIDGISATVPEHIDVSEYCDAVQFGWFEADTYMPYAYIGGIAGAAYPGAKIQLCMVEDFTVQRSGNSCKYMASVGGIVASADGGPFTENLYTKEERYGLYYTYKDKNGRYYISMFDMLTDERKCIIQNCHVKGIEESGTGTIVAGNNAKNGDSTIRKFGAITTIFSGNEGVSYFQVSKCLVQDVGSTPYVEQYNYEGGDNKTVSYSNANVVFANYNSVGKYTPTKVGYDWDYDNIWFYEEEYSKANNDNFSMLRMFLIQIYTFQSEDEEVCNIRNADGSQYGEAVSFEFTYRDRQRFSFDTTVGSQDFNADEEYDIYLTISKGFSFKEWTVNEKTKTYTAHFVMDPVNVTFKPVKVVRDGKTYYFKAAQLYSTGENLNLNEVYNPGVMHDNDKVQILLGALHINMVTFINVPNYWQVTYWMYREEGNKDKHIWDMFTFGELKINGINADGLLSRTVNVRDIAAELGVSLVDIAREGINVEVIYKPKTYQIELG